MVDRDARVGIVGAGYIGMSWSIVFTRAGLRTRVWDSDRTKLATLPDRFDHSLGVLVAHGAIQAEEVADMRARLEPVPSLAKVTEQAGYVQECVWEHLETKRAIHAELDREVPANSVLASSASTIPMTKIADGLEGRGRCVVVHPTNPPHLVPLVEVIPGIDTAPSVVDGAVEFMERVGQVPIRCEKETWGFVLNRLQFALVREALFLASEGVASISDIERCLTDGLALRWTFLGPFGVSHTNSQDIRAGLVGYATEDRKVFEDLAQTRDALPSDERLERIADDVEATYRGHSRAELIDWRDQMILELRRLKEHRPLV